MTNIDFNVDYIAPRGRMSFATIMAHVEFAEPRDERIRLAWIIVEVPFDADRRRRLGTDAASYVRGRDR
jgi:hypothetical protein